jgi:hypothetical protein
MELDLKIIEASWHRNGIGGAGFYAIIFDDAEEGRMIASLFDIPDDEHGVVCAVYNVDELAKGNISFANGNSWRGDRYEHALKPLLEEYLEREGSNRMGPFAFPGVPRGEEG